MSKNKNETIILTEDKILEQFQEWLTGCDADELARVTGELFGGNCTAFFDPDDNDMLARTKYEFTPDENYCGAFD